MTNPCNSAQQSSGEPPWRQAIEAGELGVWDLRPELETVHYSPQWKNRLGFPDPHSADSTHFWRCRVHPNDFEAMLAAIHAHVAGDRPSYEAVFRLRSNGSGYRRVQSRGRVIERDGTGRALRMVGTMIDLTDRPLTPGVGLPEGPRGSMAGLPMELPIHVLLGAQGQGRADRAEQGRLLKMVEDLLLASVAQLEALRETPPDSPT